MDRFGWRLENLREKTGYTKKEISLKLGFTANVYGAYERGERRPTLETLIKLADIYDVSLDYLIRGEEYQQKNGVTKNEEKLQSVIHYFAKMKIDDPYFLQLHKWYLLNHEDIKELSHHFEWVVQKAKNRNEKSNR